MGAPKFLDTNAALTGLSTYLDAWALAPFDQVADHFIVFVYSTISRRNHENCLVVMRCIVHVGTMLNQKSKHIQVPILCCKIQGSDAMFCNFVDIDIEV
jgi:hypothetical protein